MYLRNHSAITTLTAIGLTIAASAFPGVASAQPYPSKAVRIVVPFLPGGGTDIIARLIAARLAADWDRSVVVDNRAGAATVPGSDIVAKAAPDGHTLLLTANPHTSNPALVAKLPYDTLQDFSAVTMIASAPLILVVHPSLPVRSVQELVKLARARPGQLAYATSGNGGPQHLAGELFKSMAGLDILHVPYKGTVPATTDLIAGRVQLSFSSLLTSLPQIHASRLRALAVTSLQRSKANPEFPTLAESGLPGYESLTWYGMFSTGRTPATVIQKINADTLKALRSQDIAERLVRDGLDPVGSDPDTFSTFVRHEIEKVTKLVKAAGIKAD
jgi:tripartite-type tricarboxylate transporter receptor subunit TctC